jgi:S-adenosylmethionine hydrolase
VIVTVDAFGNLISNIDAELISGFSQPAVHIAGHDIEMRSTYGRAKPGDYLALINSFGVLEVAKAESSAAEGLGIERGAPITVSAGVAI